MFIQTTNSEKWESLSEEELWENFTEGNRQALAILFLRFYERLFRYGMYFSSNQSSVKDGIQKLFLRLWKKRTTLSCPRSVEGYLYISLRRTMLKSIERKMARNRRNTEFNEMDPEHMLSVEDAIIFEEEKREREQLFRRALHLLTPRQKEALLLRIDSGLSNQEIGIVMELSDKRVRNLIYEATKRLQEGIYRLTE